MKLCKVAAKYVATGAIGVATCTPIPPSIQERLILVAEVVGTLEPKHFIVYFIKLGVAIYAFGVNTTFDKERQEREYQALDKVKLPLLFS